MQGPAASKTYSNLAEAIEPDRNAADDTLAPERPCEELLEFSIFNRAMCHYILGHVSVVLLGRQGQV